MKKAEIRKPAQAGRFYPGSRKELNSQIESFAVGSPDKSSVLGCVLPHAGYIYSGSVAVETVSRIIIKDRLIMIGPNHTGLGKDYSIMTAGTWQTPLGDVEIDSELADALLKKSDYLEDDPLAHMTEHSLEVELPILQYFKPDFKFVPIAVISRDLSVLKEIGKQIASVIRESGIEDSVMFVASSDMTHYESQTTAQRKDTEAINAILGLDEDKLTEKVRGLNISMCGYAPVVIMLSAVKSLGAKSAKLIKYQTSGDITGDYSAVVGYAGIIIN